MLHSGMFLILWATTLVVSGSRTWSLLGSRGEILELWEGPGKTILTHGGEPPKVIRVSGFWEIKKEGKWVDARRLPWDPYGSRPGLLSLDDYSGTKITFFSRKKPSNFPVVSSLETERKTWARFNLFVKNVQGSWRSLGSGVHVFESGQGKIFVSGHPAARWHRRKTGISIEFRNSGKALVAISLFPGPTAREIPGLANTRMPRMRIHTGYSKFDDMFQASVDAVLSSQFESGVVIAGSDYWYKNAWIRDGTYSIIGLDLAGLHDAAERFYLFWVKEGGFSWGGENEAQQPAICILGMWLHSKLTAKGKEFLGRCFGYVKSFCNYYEKRIAREGMINTAEEWICQVPTKTSWPNAEIHAGLVAGSRIAKTLGHRGEAREWLHSAQTLKKAIFRTAWSRELKRFIPLAGKEGRIYRDPQYPKSTHRNGPMRDERIDSGMLMLARPDIFGRGLAPVPANHPFFVSTLDQIRKRLLQPDFSCSRFEGNGKTPWYRQGQWPVWPIISCWWAQMEYMNGKRQTAWKHILKGLLDKKGYDAYESLFQLPEQWFFDGRYVPTTKFLAWSHGEFLTTSVFLLLGLKLSPGRADLELYPYPIPGKKKLSFSGFRFKGWSFSGESRVEGGFAGTSISFSPDPGASPRPVLLKVKDKIFKIEKPGSIYFTVSSPQRP